MEQEINREISSRLQKLAAEAAIQDRMLNFLWDERKKYKQQIVWEGEKQAKDFLYPTGSMENMNYFPEQKTNRIISDIDPYGEENW